LSYLDAAGRRGQSARRMASEAPNLAYYRAVAGAWRARLDFAITDRAAFRACAMPAGDRLSLAAMARLAPRLGGFRLDTSVSFPPGAPGQVVHTTRVSKWGMTLLRSVDTLTPDANGRDLTMRVDLRLWPALWRVRTVVDGAPVRIDAGAREADYRFAWFGTEMHQHGARSADGATVTLTQVTAWSRGVQVLRRR
jgi:hypothetical protein